MRGPFGVEYAWRPCWSFWERVYVRIFGFVDLPGRLRARLIIREILARQPHTVLDLGSGTGCYSFFLSRDPGTEVWGVDADPWRIRESNSILNRLQRRNLTFSAESANAPLIHLSSGRFDLALAVEVFQYLPHIQDSLREIYRVLKPDGYLLGHVPVLGYLRPNEVTLFSQELIFRLLEGAGFGNIQVSPTFHGTSRKLCHIYEKISALKWMVPLVFPWLLWASRWLEIRGPQGNYRLFTAQKVVNAEPGGGILPLSPGS